MLLVMKIFTKQLEVFNLEIFEIKTQNNCNKPI